MTTEDTTLPNQFSEEKMNESSDTKRHCKQVSVSKPVAPPPPNGIQALKPRAPPPPASPRKGRMNEIQSFSCIRETSADEVIIQQKQRNEMNTEKPKIEIAIHATQSNATLQKLEDFVGDSDIKPRSRSFSDTYGRLKEVPNFQNNNDKKKKKKKFGIFKKKDIDFEISEPTGFDVTISMRTNSTSNPLNKFDGKTERALIPLEHPLPLLNKREVTSPNEYFELMKEMEKEQLFYDEWSSPIVPCEKWLMNYSNGWENESLIFVESIKDGYCIEIGEGACTLATELKDYQIVDITSDFNYFNTFVKGNPLAEHYILTEEPTALSIIPPSHNGFRRGIVMNKRGATRCLLPIELTKIKEFKTVFPDLTRGEFYKLSSANKEKFEQEIGRIETMSSISHYKFGVLYCKSHQTNEDEMFGNTEGNEAFSKFLDLLGNKIKLNGFEKYRGGLDVKCGSTGEYSYYSQFLGYEIMFHVSTLLPEQPGDLQRVEKKRHIGNDVVVIIFKEQSNDPNDKFDPKWLTSQFNHIFIIVEPNNNTKDNNGYSITVGCKSSVNPFPPFMTTNHFNHDESTREFILRKAVNGERTALFSTAFKGNATKTRKQQFSLLFESLKN